MKQYGRITYNFEKHHWAIECEPHVSLRLKRVFPKLDDKQFGVVVLSDTIENCHDLEWFLQRYPMEVASGGDILKAGAQKHRDDVSFIDKLLSAGYEPPNVELAIPARNYQLIAGSLNMTTGGILLADDVGTGKTASAITTFADPRTLPALVVTLANVMPQQWEREVHKFLPRLTTHVIKKGTPYDLNINDPNGLFPPRLPDVIIMNYHKLAGWAETLAPLIKSVVWDECQEIRRAESAKYSAAKFVSKAVDYRMGLSATPIYNYGEEIWNVMNCIRPGALGTRYEFLNEWCVAGNRPGQARIKDPHSFGTYMRESGLMLRRTRSDVGRELPGLTTPVHYIDADEEVLNKVSGHATALAQIILNQNKEQFRGQKMQASEDLSNLLRQATGIAKAPYVAEFIKMLVESGEQVLVGVWHREVYGILMEKLLAYNPVMFSGSESVRQKMEAKEAFMTRQTPVMLMSLRSGAGIDGLQEVCRTAVLAEFDWSPGVHEQFFGRIARDGQKDPVLGYYLAAEFGSDPVMIDTLGIKQDQVDGIRHVDKEIFSQIPNDGGHIKKLAEQYLERMAA